MVETSPTRLLAASRATGGGRARRRDVSKPNHVIESSTSIVVPEKLAASPISDAML